MSLSLIETALIHTPIGKKLALLVRQDVRAILKVLPEVEMPRFDDRDSTLVHMPKIKSFGVDLPEIIAIERYPIQFIQEFGVLFIDTFLGIRFNT